MNIKLYRIRSCIEDAERNNENTQFIEDINNLLINEAIELDEFADDSNLNVVLVESGGSEQEFLKLMPQLKDPILLINNGRNNALAASFEIKTRAAQEGRLALQFTGDAERVSSILKEVISVSMCIDKLAHTRLGVIGKPSDWLIGSNVSYKEVKDRFGIELVDIDYQELVDEINLKNFDYPRDYDKYLEKAESEEKLDEALYIYGALKRICKKHKLDGFTIRCFDLLTTFKATSCLALAILNQEGIIAGCEGDIPTLISMAVANAITGSSSFQANPSYIDYENGKILFAHCTVPLNMVKNYSFDTHFESGLGIGIHGDFDLDEATVFKITPKLDDALILESKIIESPNLKGYCRSQIWMQVELRNLMDLDRIPFGNHVVIMYGEMGSQLALVLQTLDNLYKLKVSKNIEK